MYIATINRFITLFTESLEALGAKAPVADIERLAMTVHHSMDNGRRVYHTSTHVFDMCRGLNPRQVLATLFHDIVYYQLDGGFPKNAETTLKRVVRVERDALEVRPLAGDKGYIVCTQLFGFKEGQVLPLYGGMNEFLSAVVAVRTLEPYLGWKDIIPIVACIEATVPFRMKNAAGVSPLEVLAQRVTEVSGTVGFPMDEAEVTRAVMDAAELANHDVSSFSESDPGRFLSTTWLLIEESNAPLSAVGGAVVLVVVSEILDQVSALGRIRNGLPTHYWLAWLDLLVDPVNAGQMTIGLLQMIPWVVLPLLLAFRHFSRKDILS